MDGFDVIIKRSRDEEFKNILSSWERVIGNDILGNFEYTEFQWIAQTSVNDYIAQKADGTVKLKGDFEINKELHKNTSMRIVPIMLHEYFTKNIPVENSCVSNYHYKIQEEGKLTESYVNIYDFCIRQKSSRDFHYEGILDNKVSIYNKLIRYYVSKEGEKIYKVKNPECMTRAANRSQVEAGEWLCTVCNFLSKDTKVEDVNINFKYYIDKAERIIKKINKSYVCRKDRDTKQLSLW